jgi:mono/diheme cytochrome c family protein
MSRDRIVKALIWTAAALLLVAALAVGAVYGGNAWITTRQHDVPLEPAPVAAAAFDAVEARRLAILVGCVSCHGRSGGGGSIGLPGVVQLGVPNLTKVMPEYSDAELVRLLRFGVLRNGTTAIGMPSAAFYPLSDADLARLIAYLRSLPPARDIGPGRGVREFSFLARVGLMIGKLETSVAQVDRAAPRWGELPRTTPFERGRYWASIVCAECHRPDLQGDELLGSPSLAIVRAYDLEQFRHLLRTGEPLSKVKLGLMADVSKADFVSFRDDEIDDLYAFLSADTATAIPRTP